LIDDAVQFFEVTLMTSTEMTTSNNTGSSLISLDFTAELTVDDDGE
jgi:hypothetical protein